MDAKPSTSRSPDAPRGTGKRNIDIYASSSAAALEQAMQRHCAQISNCDAECCHCLAKWMMQTPPNQVMDSSNPHIERFVAGHRYRLATHLTIPSLPSGIMEVKAELGNLNPQFATRLILCDIHFTDKAGVCTKSVFGVRCFVENGVAIRSDALGEIRKPTEIAIVPSGHSFEAKAYAADMID